MERTERRTRNERALALVTAAEKSGERLSKERRRDIMEMFTGLGGLVETVATGLAGLAEARAKGFAQFFTPAAVGLLMAELLAIPDGAAVFDPAIGSGRLLFELHDRLHITGIELEEGAYRVSRACLPKAAIVRGDLIDYLVENTFDYVLGNPPFSLTLVDQRRRYENTHYAGRILSHRAWLELAIRSVRPGGFVAAVLPKEVLSAADTIAFHRWLNARAREVARVHLPKDTFEATEWPCILSIYEKQPERGDIERFEYVLTQLGTTNGLLGAWRRHLDRHPAIAVGPYAAAVVAGDTPIVLRSTRAKPRRADGERPAFALETTAPEIRLIVGERLRLKSGGLMAALALEELRLAAPTRFERKRKIEVNEWDELRRKPLLLHEDALIEQLATTGIGLWMEAGDQRRLERARTWLGREQIPFERAIRTADGWQSLFTDEGLMTARRDLFDSWLRRAKAMGLDQILYPFQLIDVARLAMKRSALICLQQGLGKTRVAVSLQRLIGSKRGLYVVPSKLVGEWENEFKSLGLAVHIIDSYAATKRLGQFNLVAYEALWRVPRDSPRYRQADWDAERKDDEEDDAAGTKTRHLKHTLAALLRRRSSYIALDEAYYIKNPDALRSRAVYHLQAKRRFAMTGTPIKGYPQNILGLLNWTFGAGSSRLPDYSYYEEGGVRRFLDTFGTYVYYDDEHAERGDKGKKKQIPKINNVDAFYELLKAKMVRRLKNEPDVAAAIKTADPIVEYVRLPLEGDHRRFYEAWLSEFVKWYQARLKREHLGGKKLGKMELLAKLGYLIQAATVPQSANLRGGASFIAPYSEGPTTLQRWAIVRAKEAALAGEKVIVFSRFIESLAYLERELRSLDPLVVTGSVSLARKKKTGKSERQELVEAFRKSSCPVLLAGTTCLSEGMNIPEASVGIFCDYDWTPSIMFQALFRMVRPQQRRQVRGYFLTVTGTIMDYMQTLCELKQNAIDEGIDYQDNDFDLSDVPDIEQYCKSVVDARGHVPEKRKLYLPNTDEEVADDPNRGGADASPHANA